MIDFEVIDSPYDSEKSVLKCSGKKTEGLYTESFAEKKDIQISNFEL